MDNPPLREVFDRLRPRRFSHDLLLRSARCSPRACSARYIDARDAAVLASIVQGVPQSRWALGTRGFDSSAKENARSRFN